MSRIIPIEVDPGFKPPVRRSFDRPVASVESEPSNDAFDDDISPLDLHRRAQAKGKPSWRRASEGSIHLHKPPERVLQRRRSDIERVFDEETRRHFGRGFEDEFLEETRFWEPRFHPRTRNRKASAPTTRNERVFREEEKWMKNGNDTELVRDDFDEIIARLMKDEDIDPEFHNFTENRGKPGEIKTKTRTIEIVKEIPCSIEKEKEPERKTKRPSWSGVGSIEIPVLIVKSGKEMEEDEITERDENKKEDGSTTEDFVTTISVEKYEPNDQVQEQDKKEEQQTIEVEEIKPENEAKVETNEKKHETEGTTDETKANKDEAESSEMSKIQRIEKQLKALQLEVQNTKAEGERKNNKHFVRLEELMMRCMIELDMIEANGDEEIRGARRSAVNRVQKALRELEQKGAKNEENNNVMEAGSL